MKKFFSILLLLILLFNLYGYRVWFYYLQQQSDGQIISSLDRNEYNDADLITIKVPLSLPYYNSWKDFERYDGSIEVEGEHYNYVKRKVSNDTLILLCIPNKEKNQLTSSEKKFEGLISSQQAPNNGNKANNPLTLLKLLAGEYNNDAAIYLPPQPTGAQSNYFTICQNIPCYFSIACPWQPPDFIC